MEVGPGDTLHRQGHTLVIGREAEENITGFLVGRVFGYRPDMFRTKQIFHHRVDILIHLEQTLDAACWFLDTER